MQAETQRARQAAADAEAAAAEAFAEAGPEASPQQHRPDSASPQGPLDVGILCCLCNHVQAGVRTSIKACHGRSACLFKRACIQRRLGIISCLR